MLPWELVISTREAQPFLQEYVAITRAGGGLAFGIELKIYGASLFDVIWLGGSILADIVIAITMTIMMLRKKNTTTERMMNSIVRLTVKTGTATGRLTHASGSITSYTLETASIAALDLLFCMIIPVCRIYAYVRLRFWS
ncbi:hypothetical protein DAEQUDRAFT_731253 [Daedalea quercina L-15889]|uniref:DUF6534 domain-containing protein n=1 Tax=Daedalea quercina L-15889 TaxID=1314783 RepID=A0A165ME53_9APHY|nr:hypothetical protein DAEQUDRAFT_731253 [Daedalea quercina L-15889]